MTDRLQGSLYTKIDKQLAVTTFGHPNANSVANNSSLVVYKVKPLGEE